MTLLLDREGQELTITAVPAMDKIKNLFGEEVGERYMLGIVRRKRSATRRHCRRIAARQP